MMAMNMMTFSSQIVGRGLSGVVMVLALVFAGCDAGTQTSLYDPNRTSDVPPTLTSLSPEGAALAGVDVVAISGTDFSPVAEENLVYFGAEKATIVSASPTLLEVIPPSTPMDEASVRVAVLGSDAYSNELSYRLEAPFVRFGGITKLEEPLAIASDAIGNLYMVMSLEGRIQGVYQLDVDTEDRTLYGKTTFPYRSMVIDAAGQITAGQQFGLFQMSGGGAREALWTYTNDFQLLLRSIATDSDGHYWLVGNRDKVYHVSLEGTFSAYDLPFSPRAIYVDGDRALISGELEDGTRKVWSFPITVEKTLGDPSEIYNTTSALGPDAFVSAITVAPDGAVMLGTNQGDPIVAIEPSGSASVLYPGILGQPDGFGPTPVVAMAWAPGGQLYVSLAKVVADDGSDAPNMRLIRVNTRR